MKTKKMIVYFFSCFSFFLQAQSLSGDYQGYLYQKYYIAKYNRGKYVLIDSLKLDVNGTYEKKINPKIYTPNTLYVVVSEGEYIEKKSITNPHPHNSISFIYMGDDVSYKTSWRQETGYLNFIKGGTPSNHIKELNKSLEKIQTLLNQMELVIKSLEINDTFYNLVIDDYIKKASIFNTYCQTIAEKYAKGSYMNLYALMYQQVVPQKGMTFNDFENYRAKNLFKFTDLKNPLVANIPLLSEMYKSYLFYNQPSGFVSSDKIQKMEDDAKTYIHENACPEVKEALNIQEYRSKVQILRKKLLNDINFDLIYQDDVKWFTEINEVLGAYEQTTPYHFLFGKDIITALERTQNPKAYTKLAEAAFSITEQFNWNNAQAEIIDYLAEKSDIRLLNENNKISRIFATKNIKKGKQAPDLILAEFITSIVNDEDNKLATLSSQNFAKKGSNKTILLFYQAGCSNCEILIKELIENYERLKNNGYNIITISADESKQDFKVNSKDFPWPEKYCDFKGKNFYNYAVFGTPTIYLIDKFGYIEENLTSIKGL